MVRSNHIGDSKQDLASEMSDICTVAPIIKWETNTIFTKFLTMAASVSPCPFTQLHAIYLRRKRLRALTHEGILSGILKGRCRARRCQVLREHLCPRNVKRRHGSLFPFIEHSHFWHKPGLHNTV